MTTLRKYMQVGLIGIVFAVVGLVLAPTLPAQTTLRPVVTNSFEVNCTNSVVINSTSAATTQLVALSAGTQVHVCGFLVNQVGAATAPTFKFVQGTGTNCGTGTADLTGVITGAATAGVPATVAFGNGQGAILRTAVGGALCITTTTTEPQRGVLLYAQF